MCAPCVIIINGCGIANEAAASFIDSNEQFAEVIKYLADNGTLSEGNSELAIEHCKKYQGIADTLDAFRKETLALANGIAQSSKNPKRPTLNG